MQCDFHTYIKKNKFNLKKLNWYGKYHTVGVKIDDPSKFRDYKLGYSTEDIMSYAAWCYEEILTELESDLKYFLIEQCCRGTAVRVTCYNNLNKSCIVDLRNISIKLHTRSSSYTDFMERHQHAYNERTLKQIESESLESKSNQGDNNVQKNSEAVNLNIQCETLTINIKNGVKINIVEND